VDTRDDWVSIRHAAEHADAHPDTIKRAIRRGDLPAYRTTQGGHWRIRARDLEAWQMGKSSREAAAS